MNPMELFNQVKEMIEKKDFEAAKKFVEDNKDNLGDYLDQAKGLVSGNEMVSGALDKLKGLLMKTKMIWASTSTKLNLLFQAMKWSVEL